MSVSRNHPWDLTPADAINLQQELREKIALTWKEKQVRVIAGADVSYVRRWNRAFAVICLFSVERRPGEVKLKLQETHSASMEIVYPYIPGLLVFREGPALEAVWRQIDTKPDLILFDGAGIAHPRHCGLAAHLGWRWDTPAIGCAKSRLIGDYPPVGIKKGSRVPLRDKKTQIGNVVRTRSRVKPMFVSPGHKTNFTIAVQWTLETTSRYKMPEPTRIADKKTKALVQEFNK